jgi:hypothetical protein
MASRTEQGFLIISDVSGYTAFLTGTELEHAQAIMEEITGLLLERMASPAKLVKLEGDAIFWRLPPVVGAERVLEQIERCYSAFASHRFDIAKSTTCTCAACKAIPTLDLKFFAHFGTFMVQHLAGTVEDVAGPDVILVHRLMKNSVAEKLGHRGYLLATDALLSKLEPMPVLPRHSESYEHFGEVGGAVVDLHAAHTRLNGQRREVVQSEEATLTYSHHFAASPAVLWDHYIEPGKRVRWETSFDSVRKVNNADGRHGVGAQVHCAHGKHEVMLKFRDFRPFEYFTVELHPSKGWWTGPPHLMETDVFTVLPDGRTKVERRMKLLNPSLMVRVMTVFSKGKIAQQLEAEFAQLELNVAAEAKTASAQDVA